MGANGTVRAASLRRGEDLDLGGGAGQGLHGERDEDWIADEFGESQV